MTSCVLGKKNTKKQKRFRIGVGCKGMEHEFLLSYADRSDCGDQE